MDTGSPAGASISEDVNGSDDLKQLYPELQCTCHVLEDVSLNELGNSLTEVLHIEEDQKLAPNSILCEAADKTDERNVKKEDECEDPDQTESTVATSDKCLSKCATFPSAGKKAYLAMSTDGENEHREDDITAAVLKQTGYESVKPAYSRSISLPTSLKLVSAMKGSREKRGTLPKKLTVTWAPDVYDPPPSASTFVRIKKQRPKSESKKNYDWKKNGKNKQKGKPSKGGGSKSKKQARKYVGSSNKSFQLLDYDDRVVDCNESYEEMGDFNVGSPNSYCGSSFLKKSVSKLHFSIAEAT